jgi:peptidoglycan/xylan/chitin deacetylase (PgdA/CDA1 family)
MKHGPTTYDKYSASQAEQQIERAIETLKACRQQNDATRVAYESAEKHADGAKESALQLARKLHRLDISSGRSAIGNAARPDWRRLISQLDQAEAAACDVLRADAGDSVDRLAEILGVNLQNIGAEISKLTAQADFD